jgi:carboxypeptidase Taq
MPAKGNEARAAAIAELAALMHRLRTDPAWASRSSAPSRKTWTTPSAPTCARSARLAARHRAARRSGATARDRPSRCEHAWRTQRPAGDWAGFVENFRPVLAIAREQAARLADAAGGGRYEALMDGFEPGMTTATVDRVFGELRQWLPG